MRVEHVDYDVTRLPEIHDQPATKESYVTAEGGGFYADLGGFSVAGRAYDDSPSGFEPAPVRQIELTSLVPHRPITPID